MVTTTVSAEPGASRHPSGAAASPGRRSGLGKRQRILLRIASVLVLLTMWQLLGDDSKQMNFPTLTRTIASIQTLVESGELQRAVWDSDQTLFLGYVIGLAVAVPLGLLMGLSRIFRAGFQPYITVMMTIPMIAIIPILQAIFGLGFFTRVLVVVLFTIPYVATSIATGTYSLPNDLDEMSRSFSGSRWFRLRNVVIPYALPTAMTGIRLGLAHALIGMVIAELYLVSSGIGSLLTLYRGRFDAGAVFAIAIAVIAQGYLLLGIARWAERYVTRKARPA